MLSKVYFGEVIGIRVANTVVVIFEEQVSLEDWETLPKILEGL
ncbi:hypothetical protein U8V72_25810 [Priestia filamentosa]